MARLTLPHLLPGTIIISRYHPVKAGLAPRGSRYMPIKLKLRLLLLHPPHLKVSVLLFRPFLPAVILLFNPLSRHHLPLHFITPHSTLLHTPTKASILHLITSPSLPIHPGPLTPPSPRTRTSTRPVSILATLTRPNRIGLIHLPRWMSLSWLLESFHHRGHL